MAACLPHPSEPPDVHILVANKYKLSPIFVRGSDLEVAIASELGYDVSWFRVPPGGYEAYHPYDHTLLTLYTERLSVIVGDCPVQMQQKIFSEIFSAKISICLTPPHSFTSATIQNQAKAFLAMQVVIDSSRQWGTASWSCNQLLLIPQTHSPGCQAACFFVKPYTMSFGDLKDVTIFTLPCQ